jgi:hypothetical protein
MHGESLEVRDIMSLTMRPATFLTVASESCSIFLWCSLCTLDYNPSAFICAQNQSEMVIGMMLLQ